MESKQYWHNFMKLVPLKAYILVRKRHKMDFWNFLSSDGLSLQIPHYRSFRNDQMSNGKRVHVLIHYKICLLMQKIDVAFPPDVTTNVEGSKLDFLTSIFDFHQIVNEPPGTNKTSSCIDLILVLQPNLVIESDVFCLPICKIVIIT